MEKNLGRVLFITGLALFIGACIYCAYSCLAPDKTFEVLASMLALEFFIYKLLTGWLIINLTVKVEPERLHTAGKEDNLAIKLTLSKGSNDSLWLTDIQVRITEVKGKTVLPPLPGSGDPSQYQYVQVTPYVIRPFGTKKLEINQGEYWNFQGNKPYYTISSGEEVVFSAYTQVDKNAIISAEVLVLGTRLFYGIESSKVKLIQWRSSVVILPV